MINISSFVKNTLLSTGKIAAAQFSKTPKASQKQDQSNVLTQTDLAVEKFLVTQIERRFPDDSIIAEESRFINKDSSNVWVIDPINGTSNFAAGISWFGVMIVRLVDWQPVIGGVYLPILQDMYFAEKGKGATKNGKRIYVIPETELRNTLVNYEIDYSSDPKKKQIRNWGLSNVSFKMAGIYVSLIVVWISVC